MSQVISFLKNDTGAVTVDWVVLTAGIVTLGLVVGVTVSAPATGIADNIGAAMSTMAPQTY